MRNLLEITKSLVPGKIKRRFSTLAKEKIKNHIVSVIRTCRRLNAGSRALPSFIIAGAQKCGTTALYFHLSRHPCITPALQKELNYFNWNYQKGINWYRANFPVLSGTVTADQNPSMRRITGEASPYYFFYPHAMGRIAEVLPNVRIVIILRNPVDRAYSSYQHQVRRGREIHSFEQALELEDDRLAQEYEKISRDENYFSYNHAHFAYLARGLYAEQVERCFSHFPKDQVFVIEGETYFRSPSTVYSDLLEFLSLPPADPPGHKNNGGVRYPKMNHETRTRLVEFYRPHNQRLYGLLGRTFSWDK